jgi:hypothetical protein
LKEKENRNYKKKKEERISKAIESKALSLFVAKLQPYPKLSRREEMKNPIFIA